MIRDHDNDPGGNLPAGYALELVQERRKLAHAEIHDDGVAAKLAQRTIDLIVGELQRLGATVEDADAWLAEVAAYEAEVREYADLNSMTEVGASFALAHKKRQTDGES